MNPIKPADFVNRGWKEQEYAGEPKPLFFVEDPKEKEPWKKMPHLHIGYGFNGMLLSLTYKTKLNQSYALFAGAWLDQNFQYIQEKALHDEAKYVKSYAG